MTSTSKLLRIILSIGAVGLLLINQNYQVYDDLDKTSTLDLNGSVAIKTPSSNSDDTKDRQLRKPKKAVAEEQQLDFAVIGFEKTGASVDVHIMCHSRKSCVFNFQCFFTYYFTANNVHYDANLPALSLCLYRHNISTRSVREPSRNHHASETLPRRGQNMRPERSGQGNVKTMDTQPAAGATTAAVDNQYNEVWCQVFGNDTEATWY